MGTTGIWTRLGLGEGNATPTDRVRARMHLHAVLPRLVELCALDGQAGEIARGLSLSLEMAVLGGPRVALSFDKGTVAADPAGSGTLGLAFPTCAALNRMFDGAKVVPIPWKGLWKLGQIKGFEKLSDLLTRYLKPTPEALADPRFRAAHVELSLLVGLAATDAVLALDPKVARLHHALHPGVIQYEVGDDIAAVADVTRERVRVWRGRVDAPTTTVRLRDVDLAVELIAGRVDTFAALGTCDIRILGSLPVADDFNALFDRVGHYLA